MHTLRSPLRIFLNVVSLNTRSLLVAGLLLLAAALERSTGAIAVRDEPPHRRDNYKGWKSLAADADTEEEAEPWARASSSATAAAVASATVAPQGRWQRRSLFEAIGALRARKAPLAIVRAAATRALGGGQSGAAAGAVQVVTMMWLRTIMNYQYVF